MTGAKLYSWGPRVLYIGPAFNLSPHRNAVAVLAIGLEAAFDVARDPAAPAAGYRQCRSVLIPPNTLHHLTNTSGLLAFLYMDAHSTDFRRLMAAAAEPGERAAFGFAHEAEFIAALQQLAAGAATWTETRKTIHGLLGNAPGRTDPRVRQALSLMIDDPSGRLTLEELAAAVDLSASRFSRLFAAGTGVPLRRYKIWIAMGAATRAMMQGESLTAAALESGFDSSAHFSAAFRDMFGMEPSRLAKALGSGSPENSKEKITQTASS